MKTLMLMLMLMLIVMNTPEARLCEERRDKAISRRISVPLVKSGLQSALQENHV